MALMPLQHADGKVSDRQRATPLLLPLPPTHRLNAEGEMGERGGGGEGKRLKGWEEEVKKRERGGETMASEYK